MSKLYGPAVDEFIYPLSFHTSRLSNECSNPTLQKKEQMNRKRMKRSPADASEAAQQRRARVQCASCAFVRSSLMKQLNLAFQCREYVWCRTDRATFIGTHYEHLLGSGIIGAGMPSLLQQNLAASLAAATPKPKPEKTADCPLNLTKVTIDCFLSRRPQCSEKVSPVTPAACRWKAKRSASQARWFRRYRPRRWRRPTFSGGFRSECHTISPPTVSFRCFSIFKGTHTQLNNSQNTCCLFGSL